MESQSDTLPLTSSEKYEEKVCRIMSYDELLSLEYEDASEGVYADFTGALACVFDIDHRVIGAIANRDYINLPNIIKGRTVLLLESLTSRDFDIRYPIESVLSFMFCSKDPVYDEGYEKTDRVNGIITLHLINMIKQHGSLIKYFEWISLRLLKGKNYIANNYEYYIKKAVKIEKTLVSTYPKEFEW